MLPLPSPVPQADTAIYLGTFSPSYIDHSESLSTYSRKQYQQIRITKQKKKKKRLPRGLHKMRALLPLRSSH